ncbi:MAG: nucleotidyl transferase AbiEii/AbiGii toxin family protein, partial [Rivularia sp. (in: cyanobacteria)]
MKITENKIKFTVYNLLGEEKAYYIVDKFNLDSFKIITNSGIKIEEPLAIDYSYQVFLSESANKINCTAGILKIDDLQPEDTGIIYKYKQISKETYNQLEIPVVQKDRSVYALAKANLVEGNLNFAKYTINSTGNATLIARHAKALTNQQLASFEFDIDSAIFGSETIGQSEFHPMQKSDKISLLELMHILEKHRHSIIINLKHLRENYQYKSVQRLPGSRDANGNLVKPWLKTEYIDDGEYVGMGCFEMNRNTATINMLVTRKVKLVKAEDETPIIEIAGLLANDLIGYNNYTIVSDGEVNVKSLYCKISSKKTFDVLKQLGVIDAETFDFRDRHTVDLDLPLVPLDGKYSNIDGLFDQIAEVKILASIVSAYLKQESDNFIPEQLDELKKHYLSEHLYLNFPTVKAEGAIDARISYKIDIGSKDILNLSKLYSDNKFLERRYEVYDIETGEIFSKPSLEMTLRENIAVRQKSLSSRMKI